VIGWLAIPAAVADPWWLHPAERAAWGRLRDDRRKAAWAFGRLAAKRLLRAHLADAVSLADICILPRIRHGRPCPTLGDRPLPWNLSISHSDRFAAALLGTGPVGVDVIRPFLPGEGFLGSWFTHREREWVGTDVAVVWALKEAVYKAVNFGERFVPRAVEIRATCGRYSCAYHGVTLGLRLRVESIIGTDEMVAVVTTDAAD
jgi:phosphopantetheinyl transferase